MIPREMKEKYLKKTGDERIIEGIELWDEEKGFVVFKINHDNILMYHMYGDGKYWAEKMMDIARRNGVKKIQWASRRKPGAWIRRFGCKLDGYIFLMEVK